MTTSQTLLFPSSLIYQKYCTYIEPKTGWEATYIEATFNDGYVATSQVYITPDEKYPQTAPPSVNAACQTLPGRGLGENDSLD